MAGTILAESARYTAQSGGDAIAAVLIASKAGARTDVRKHLEAKAAVAAGRIGSGDYQALGQAASTAFVDATRPRSLALKLFESGVIPIPTATRAVVVIADATASAIGEGAPIPVSSIALAGHELEPRKAISLVVLTAELLRSTSLAGRRLLDNSLQAGVAAALDRAFLAVATAGVTPIPSAGPTAADALVDTRRLLDAVAKPGASLHWLVAQDVANAGSTLSAAGDRTFPTMTPAGGELLGLPAFVSGAIPAGTLILVDASAFGGEISAVEIDYSDQAALEMSDAPASPPTSATVLSSMWQSNQVALRATASFALEKLRDDAVAVLDGVAWASP